MLNILQNPEGPSFSKKCKKKVPGPLRIPPGHRRPIILNFKIDIKTDEVTDSLMSIYILSKFQAIHAGRKLKIDWVGYECDYDITYVYVESEKFSLDSTLLIDQTLLMEIFDDQENVLDFESSKIEESYILIRGRHQAEIRKLK